MRRLWRLIGGVPPEEWAGLVLTEDAAWRVTYSGDVSLLLQGIKDVLPRDATLYLEAPKNAVVIKLLQDNPATVSEKIQVGTILPRGKDYHLPNHSHLIERLIDLGKEMAAPELADHLVVYRDQQVLVSAYDLGEKEVWVSRVLGEELCQRFLDSVGGMKDL